MSRTLARPASLALGAALLAVACTPSRDCRYAQWACAPGFQCVQEEGGAWECRPNASLSPPGQPLPAPPSLAALEGKVPPPPGPGAPAAPVVPVNCTGQPVCDKDALECRCDAQNRLLSAVFDLNHDGMMDECARYRYPAPNKIIVEVEVGCGQGVDLIHTHELDAAGHKTFWSTEYLEHPEKNLYRRFRYESGKLVATETALGKPENLIQRCDYQPPCPPPIPNPQCKPVCENLDKKLPGQ